MTTTGHLRERGTAQACPQRPVPNPDEEPRFGGPAGDGSGADPRRKRSLVVEGAAGREGAVHGRPGAGRGQDHAAEPQVYRLVPLRLVGERNVHARRGLLGRGGGCAGAGAALHGADDCQPARGDRRGPAPSLLLRALRGERVPARRPLPGHALPRWRRQAGGQQQQQPQHAAPDAPGRR
eukprot:3516395-Rhodomonas_salina.2